MSPGDSDSGTRSPSLRLGMLTGLLNRARSRGPKDQSPSDAGSERSAAREEERVRKLEEQREFERRVQVRRRLSDELARQTETPEQRAQYGARSVYDVEREPCEPLRILAAQNDALVAGRAPEGNVLGTTRRVRARIHTVRKLGARLVFMVLREQLTTLQAVLAETPGGMTAHMLHWARRLPVESIVIAQGTLQAPVEPITGCSITHMELKVTHLYLVSANVEQLPFSVYVAERAANHRLEEHEELQEEESSADTSSAHTRTSSDHDGDAQHPLVTMRTRLTNRLIDLRTPTSQAIFRMQSEVCHAFRAFLLDDGFLEVHTPKLQGGASESGASVFQVAYFGRSAFLAQSPQLYKQMCIAADMRRVFEIGPVFRAENSNTARHMTEYTGLDLEMEVNHYYDAVYLIDAMIKHIFRTLHKRCDAEVRRIQQHYPSTELLFLERTPILSFAEGNRMLCAAGYRNDDGTPPSPHEDLSTRAEIRLGELVREQYSTDYYILDKFPASARPFYALLDPQDARLTNSFDIFVRGQEICTGGQRIHDADMLEARVRDLGIDASGLEEYLEGFRLGAPPHAGCGIGLERFLMLYLNLDDIRLASLFYRDPKSFAAKTRHELRHPEASTNPAPWRTPSRGASVATTPRTDAQLQEVEKLIANYGDSSNTSWLDERIAVWRHADTGAAIGYARRRHYALVIGNPLCDARQYGIVITDFLHYITKQRSLKPVWLMAGEPVEQILGGRFGWCTLSCTADQRIDDVRRNPARQDPIVQRKVRRAERDGVTVHEVPQSQHVPDALREECDARIEQWHASRRGAQVHLTDVQPWVDELHRTYFFARDSEKRICCLVVLAQLSPEAGYQVKWALNFPDAPPGAIEMTILQALDAVSTSPVTFGTAATGRLTAVHGLSGIAFKILSKVYANVVDHTHLLSKGEFREKLGTYNDPTFVCYPKHGLSMLGVRDIIDFFRASN
ncbi:aspartate--tRNA ligase [Malassezia sp. CBS 17886]|nr:aspartate--tRNA ligase [Malassezia sp. CBS 17886]